MVYYLTGSKVLQIKNFLCYLERNFTGSSLDVSRSSELNLNKASLRATLGGLPMLLSFIIIMVSGVHFSTFPQFAHTGNKL